MIGHHKTIESFEKLFLRGNMASTYLFVGQEGIGKRLFAEGLAEALLCRNRPAGKLQACGSCPGCIQVRTGSHPDVLRVSKPADKNVLPIELFVGDREHRSETGLCRDIRMRPQVGTRRIAIIDDADYLNQESGNVLLKTLEEPPPGALIILIGSSSHRQLKTILSRCQLVRFSDLTPSEIVAALQAQANWEYEHDINQLSLAADGSVETAIVLTDSHFADFRSEWIRQLATGDPGSNDFGASIVKFAEEGVKEAALKRERMYFVADQGVRFYSQLLRQFSGSSAVGDDILLQAVELARQKWQAPLSHLSDSIDRLCDFETHIETNANSANAVDLLLSDLHRLHLGQSTVLSNSR
jgi:DNA polymerase-3 subunit delta'